MLVKEFEKNCSFLKKTTTNTKIEKRQFQELYTIQTVARMTYVPTK